MLQIHHFLCLVSLPVSSSAALRQAVHLAAGRGTASPHGATVHVVPREAVDPSAFEKAVQQHVGQVGDTISIDTNVFSESDEPETFQRAVRRYANTIDADLLVLDPPTTRDPVSPLSDDWTEALVTGLDCPVFVVEDGDTPASIDRVLVPIDFSDQSVEMLQHGTELAACYDASVVLLHVIDTSPYVALTPVDRLLLGSTTLSEHRARHRLQQFLKKGRPPEVPISSRLAFGDPADRIVHFVTEQTVDLLVVGSHGDTGRSGASLGAVADRVLRRVTCSTLLVWAGGQSLLSSSAASNSVL